MKNSTVWDLQQQQQQHVMILKKISYQVKQKQIISCDIFLNVKSIFLHVKAVKKYESFMQKGECKNDYNSYLKHLNQFLYLNMINN